MKAGIGTRENGVRVFEMEATGEAGFSDKTYPAKVKLRIDLGGRGDDLKRVSWPRGVYELGLTGNNNYTYCKTYYYRKYIHAPSTSYMVYIFKDIIVWFIA